jgi:hypothetical protein
MIHIIFSLNWILKNDVEPDPNTVKITFPISWVSDAPTVLDGDKPIELSVPKQLFDDHNESKDPSLVTAVFPNDYFKGLPVATKLPDVSPSPQLIISPPCMNFYTVPGGSPGSEVFLISAISGPLDWSLTKDATWLAISKKQGRATNEDEIITISVDTSGLGLGTYHTDIFLINESAGSIRKIPVNLFVTFVVSGEIPDIQILKEPSVFPLEGLILEHFSVAIDTMVKSGENPGHGYWYNTGDLCLVVRGKMRNTTEKDLTVGFRGVGYDENGNEVAWTLDASYLAGVANIDVPHQSTVDFKLTISWAENVKLIKVSAGQGMVPPK